MPNLNKHQKEYIEQHVGKKSNRQISRELKISKKELHKYIKSLEKARPLSVNSDKPRLPQSFALKISENQKIIIQIILIFAVAFLIRLVYVNQLSNTYFFAPFKGGFDDYIFDNWAQEILKGNWLGDKSIYIYRMPLYTYFLSLIYFIFGHSYWALYVIQSLLGSAACILLYFIGKIAFTRNVGFIAGLIAALYGPFIFYSGMLVGETLGIFVICLAFLCLLLFQKNRRLPYLFLGGLFIGLSMLLRGNILVMFPFILLWIIMLLKKQPFTLICSAVLIFITGTILSISPIIARNYIYEKDFVPVTASGGLNIYIGNAYGADGKFRSVEGVGTSLEDMLKNSVKIAEQNAGKGLKPSAVSNYWLRETARSIKEHGPLFLSKLVMNKFIMFWNSYELPDIWDYYFFKLYIPLLNLPLFSFLLIAPLSIAGLYLGWTRRADISLFYVFISGYILSLLITFITARYRSQIVPFLIILASFSLVRMKELLVKDKGKFIVCSFVLIGSFLFCNILIEKISFETSFNSLGILLKRDGKIGDAIATYKKAIDLAPKYPSPYYNLGILYRDTGEYGQARVYFKKALEAAPDFTAAQRELENLPVI